MVLKENGIENPYIFDNIMSIDSSRCHTNAYIIALFFINKVSLVDLKRVFGIEYINGISIGLTKRNNMDDKPKMLINHFENSPMFDISPDGFKELEKYIMENQLSYQVKNLEWFINLTMEMKIMYIKKGHHLTDEQFNYLNK